MSFIHFIYQDKYANYQNPTKGKYIVVMFRIAQYVKRHKILYILCFWYLFFYRVVVEWGWGVELSWNTRVGAGLQIYHGTGLVVHPDSIIGKNCSLRQCTTLGVKLDQANLLGMAPVIGDNVDIGCNVCIIGHLQIGDFTTIGAGSVVTKDIPPQSVAAGNPARIIHQREL